MNHIQELSGADTNEKESKQTEVFAYKLCLILILISLIALNVWYTGT